MDSVDWVVVILFALAILALGYLLISGVQMREKSNYETKLYLIEFKQLDCKGMGDSLLQKYLDDETGQVREALPIFKESGCSFDVATKLILEKP